MLNIQKLKDLMEKVNFVEFEPTKKQKIKICVVKNIAKKLISLLEQLNNQDDLLKLSLTLRYFLETTIISKLLVKEKEYFLKFYYALNPLHEKNLQRVIKRIKEETSFLDELNIEYETEVSTKNNTANSNEIILEKYKSKIDNQIHIYIEDLDKCNFVILKSLLKQKLDRYENELKKIKKITKEEIQKVSREEWFTEYFDQEHQYTQTLIQLKDCRSWKEKSIHADLEREYILTYEYISSLLHVTSFSVFTENDLVQGEKENAYKLISQYVSKIAVNLDLFIGEESKFSYENFKVLNCSRL